MEMAAPQGLANTAASSRAPGGAPIEFEEVYDAHIEFVRTHVRRPGIGEACADDVVQKVFMVVYRRLGQFEQRSTIKTWLFAILLRVVREERRSIRRRLAHWWPGSGPDPDQLPFRDGATPQDELSQAQAFELVQRLLNTLEPNKREVFVLAELEELTAKEISEITGLEPTAVYSRLRAARVDFERAAHRLRRSERLGI